MSILPKKFYNRPTLRVAQDLLGCFLLRTSPQPLSKFGEGQEVRYKIVETEAYNGPKDLASHASIGRTKRNCIMFGEPGTIYVYFTYGMHYMLNIVTGKKGYPAAILIRAVEPTRRDALQCVSTNGPARLTKTLNIDKSFNNLPIYTKKHGFWIEGPPTLKLRRTSRFEIVKTARIGIDYAKAYKDKKWRFYIKGNKFVSKK